VSDETESLDRSGIDLTVGIVTGQLEVTSCIQRILRAHLETLALPTHVSEATLHTYFYVSKR
jgi:hypothetical protein